MNKLLISSYLISSKIKIIRYISKIIIMIATKFNYNKCLKISQITLNNINSKAKYINKTKSIKYIKQSIKAIKNLSCLNSER